MFIFFATCYSTIINLQWYGNMWYIGFINFLFLFHSRISFIFSFSYSVFTASISISTLPFSFFFPLPCCSILFPFMNMSHHQFPLYHHWSISFTGFFPLLFALSSLFYRRGSGCGFGLWLWFPIVGLVVIFDCDRCGRRSLGCGSLLSILYPGELTEPFRLIRE